jgi:quinol monooxygenase YgiN
MYGTVAKIMVKPGRLNDLKKVFETAHTEVGSVAGYVYQMDADPNTLYLAVVFESEQAYKANADLPETNADFEKMMQFLVTEPEWHDGTIIWSDRH